MTIQGFAEHFPRLVHVCPRTAARTVSGIGLPSFTRALRNFADEDQNIGWRWTGETDWRSSPLQSVNRMHRPRPVEVRATGEVDTAFVARDQGPLGNLKALEQHCLHGMTGPDWIELLNCRLYFFPSRDRKSPQSASAFQKKYGQGQTCLAIVNTLQLPDSIVRRIELSTINSGAINGVAKRSQSTFEPLGDFEIKRIGKVKEVTVVDGFSSEDLRACCLPDTWLAAALGTTVG